MQCESEVLSQFKPTHTRYTESLYKFEQEVLVKLSSIDYGKVRGRALVVFSINFNINTSFNARTCRDQMLETIKYTSLARFVEEYGCRRDQ